MGSAKLYVGNLSYGATEEGLANLFAQFGDVVSARIIMDRDTGRSKGFAFVEMATEDAAQQCVSHLNGQTVEGRPLTVNEARPQERREGGGGGGRRYEGGGGGGNRRY